jgi:transposase
LGRHYKDEGIDGLKEKQRSGRPSKARNQNHTKLLLRLGLKNRQVGEKWVSDDCSYLCKDLL